MDFFYLTKDELKKLKNDLILEKEDKFPCEIVLDFYKKTTFYKESPLSGTFSNRDYLKEINKIFETQDIKRFNLNEDFKDQFIKLFETIRSYNIGPGSEKSPTKYGLWQFNKETKEVEKIGDNLWDITIGKCTYYKNENRGLKNAPITEIFNLFNDLSNFSYINSNGQKDFLNEEVKKEILKLINENLNKCKNPLTLKEIINLLNKYENRTENNLIKIEENISGLKIKNNKDKKEFEIQKLNNLGYIFKFLKKYDDNYKNNLINIFENNELNKINDFFVTLSKNLDQEKNIKLLKANYSCSSEEAIKLLKNLSSLTVSSSLSYKAMNDYINFFVKNLNEHQNQMQFFTNNKEKYDLEKEISIDNKYFNKGVFDDAIISPTVRRAFNQCVNIINAILKKYPQNKYLIDNITFELPREKNSFEERKKINDFNKKNKDLLKNYKNDIKNCGMDINKLSKNQKIRIKLWADQGQVDIYNLNCPKIAFEDVLSGKNLEIDHIIPLSISNDDSFNNKVLTNKFNNKAKSNTSSCEFFNQNGSFKEFKENVEKYVQNKNKKSNLLNKNNDIESLADFTNRNLADTRYIAKLVLNTFQNFFKNRQTKIKAINGKMTNYMRNTFFTKKEGDKIVSLIPKNRDIYSHHAIDAALISFLGFQSVISKKINFFSNIDKKIIKNENGKLINKETGETIEIDKFIPKNESIMKFGKELEKYNSIYDFNEKKIIENEKSNLVKFSRLKLHKSSIALSNETIYSIKWDETKTKGFLVSSIKLIDPTNKKKFSKYFSKDNQKDKEKLIIYQKNKPLYDALCKIYEKYNNESNPFYSYMLDWARENDSNLLINNQKLICNFIIVKLNNKTFKIKKLKIKGEPKTVDKLIVLNDNEKTKKHNGNAVLESLNQLNFRLYKNKKNEFVGIPINQKVLSFKNNKLFVDEEKINELLKEKNITNKKYLNIINGTTFMDKESKKLVYAIGSCDGNKRFQAKTIHCNTLISGLTKSKDQFFISFSKISNYWIVDIDILGNIYNKREIML